MAFIDKFYRVYNPYTTTEARTSRDPTINLNDNVWDAKSLKISNVKEGKYSDDVSTLGQTLTRQGDVFVQGNSKYEFLESENNNWNAKKRKISNILQGSELTDAVTLAQTLTRKGNEFIQGENKYEFIELKNNKWDAKKHKIEDLAAGTNNNDAVNLSQIPVQNKDNWDFKNKKISNVKVGSADSDCTTMQQTITLKDNKFDAKNKTLSNLKPGTQASDAATVGQIEKNVLKQNKDGQWDAISKKISNVKGGSEDNDCATIKQIEGCLKQNTEGEWDGRGKILTNIKAAVYDDECVIKEQTLTLETYGALRGNYNARGKQIKNMMGGSFGTSAATVNQTCKVKQGHLEQNSKTFNIIMEKDGTWDAQNKLIKGLPIGEDPNDICLRKQAVWYDKNTSLFKYDQLQFELIDKKAYPNLLVADPSVQSGLRRLDGTEYLPGNYVYERQDGKLISSTGGVFKCVDVEDRTIISK